MTTTTETVFQSDFGFHNCDRATYKKLRKVRYYSHINRIQYAAMDRWNRKLPKNRVLWHRVDRGTWASTPWPQPEICPCELSLLWQDLRNAMPVSTAEEVTPLKLSIEQIDSMIAECEAWLTRIGRERR